VRHAEAMLEFDVVAFAVLVAEVKEVPADDGGDGAFHAGERHSADRAGFGVGDEDLLAVGGEAGGLCKGGDLTAKAWRDAWAVDEVFASTAGVVRDTLFGEV